MTHPMITVFQNDPIPSNAVMDDSGQVRHVKFETNVRWLVIRYCPLASQ